MNGDDLLALAKDALVRSGQADAEVYVRTRSRGVARFAMSALGQHMQLEESEAIIRVAKGTRLAETRTSSLDPGSLTRAIHDAARMAAIAPEVEGFPGFAANDDDNFVSKENARPPRRAESTANATADQRVSLIAPALDRVREKGLTSAGVLETSGGAVAVATTRGCERSHDDTVASYRVWALETLGAGGASGFGSSMHRDLGKVAVQEETDRAIERCERAKNPKALDAGTYDVVFEPAAVCELMEWLGMIAFGAPEVEQGTSALAGRIGERITGENVDIRENPLDPSDLGFGVPFDREGTLRRELPIIEKGIARNVLTDRTYAAKRGEKSTGSSVMSMLVGGSNLAAVALHMGAGEAASVEELIGGMKRGLYVCRLHYVNGMLEPRRAVMTGLTRDGCYWVEDGKIRHAVGNMRFTDSILEGFARIDGMTRTRRAIPTWWSATGAYVAPAVRIRQFRFNGKSQMPPALT